MIFKEEHMKSQLERTSEFLQFMAKKADSLSQEIAGRPLVITRVTDQVQGESGVHPAGRAFDARFQSSTGCYYTRDQAERIRDEINRLFPRPDGKQSCIIHSFRKKTQDGSVSVGMEHFHFQIPAKIPDTWRISE
jgi:hypothetical protein